MLRSKYFWIAMLILVPSIIVWVIAGFVWAITTLAMMGILFLLLGTVGSIRNEGGV